MKKAIVTGCCGLVGSAAVKQLSEEGFEVIGIDNNFRKEMFGEHASTAPVCEQLMKDYKDFKYYNIDIRDLEQIASVFDEHKDADLIEHLAAAPAHEWATTNRIADFYINAVGTVNMLEAYSHIIPNAVFIHCSTSKVYGDIFNQQPYRIEGKRFELHEENKYFDGFTEELGYLDNNLRSFFGASKTCGDIMAQEYGKYLGLKIAIFRPPCITGSNHKGDKLHGFLAYLAKCIATGDKYIVNGYDGNQTRDNIHADDLVAAFYEVYKNPRHSYGETYNLGAGRVGMISMNEAIAEFERILGKKGNIEYSQIIRKGDHMCDTFSSDKFRKRYPNWEIKYPISKLMEEICSQYK